MLSLDATQLAIVDAANKDEISWLFEIDRNGNDVIDDYWSTKAKTFAAQAYTFKIADFTNIQMVRAQSESGIQAPSSFDFMVSNKDNTLSPSDFSGGNVTLKLVVKADTDEEIIRAWNFDIEGVEPGYQKLFFHCRDWLQKYLEGDYPKTPLISRLFPEDDTEHDNFCVPLIFGKPCIPIVPIVFNSIPNGYMEVDGNWANWGSTPPTVNERSNTHVKEGDYSRKFTVQGASARSGIKSDAFTTENGKTYTIEFWVYNVNWIGCNIAVRKGDDSDWNLYDKSWTATQAPVNMWSRLSVSFTEGAATGGSGAYIVFYGWAEPETARTRYIDQAFLGTNRYLLGAKITDPTDYDVEELQTPRDWDGDHQIWSKDDHIFNYSHDTGADGNDYTFGEFFVADLDSDGTPDANIVFKHSKRYLPAAAWYTRSDTISKTNPGDILDYIFQDWGIPAARIDATTLASVKNTYSGWGLTWNLGLWTQEPRKKLLARLLLMCHTELIVRDKIYFKVHSKTSQKTLTKAHITKSGEIGEGSFKYDLITSQEINDSAYIAFQEQGKCLDQLLKILVTAKGSANNTSDDIIRADYVQDSQDAQRIGTLAIQRKYLPLAKVSFTTKGTCLALECDDVITLNHADYGGNYAILIDSMTINKDLSIDIDVTRFSQALDDWGDLSPSAISIVQIPDSDSYKVVISGPDSVDAWGNYIGNILPGRLRVGQTGNHILLDPVEPLISFVEGGVVRMKIGDLGTDDYGIEFLDHAGNSIFKLDGSGNNTLCGWSADVNKLTCQSGQVGMNAEETGGTDWRFWAGNATPGSAPFRVDENGNLHCTLIYASGGTIGGWTIGATTLTSANISLDSGNDRITVGTITIDGANNRIRSGNYISGMAGAGFTLEPDLLEVGNIAARGIIRTAVFQKDIVHALGGNFIFSKGADVLATTMTALDACTLTIEGNETFAVNDILWIKDGTDEEWFEVTNIGSAPTYTVTRDKGAQYAADNNPTWQKGATVVNCGQSGDGFVYMTASETNAPYLSVITNAGAPWTTLTTHLRIGNLNGYLGYTSDLYGIAIGETNAYLKYEPTNGLRIKGLVEIIGNPALQNMLMNGGYEETDGTDAYYWEKGVGITTETSGGDGSNKYLKLVRSGSDKYAYHCNPDNTSRSFEVNEGEVYEIGGDLKSDGTCTYLLSVEGHDKDGTYIGRIFLSGTDVAWTARSGTYTVPAGVKFLKVYVYAMTANGWAAFDNVYLKRVDEKAWSFTHASDRTKIDGGHIYTNTITASQINGAGFGTLTITSGKIAINTTDALEIQAGGNIKVLAGGDIVLQATEATASFIKWDSNYDIYLGAKGNTGALKMYPSAADQGTFEIGRDTDNNYVRFQSLGFYARDSILIRAVNGTAYGYMDVQDNNVAMAAYSGTNQAKVSCVNGYITLKADAGEVKPDDNRATNLGTSTSRWNTGYFDQLDASCNVSSGYAATFFNDGNHNLRWGIKIQSGMDNSIESFILSAFDGDGTEEGHLKISTGTFELIQGSGKSRKQNIRDTAIDALKIITDLRICDFEFKKLPEVAQINLIADEVRAIFPDAVSESGGELWLSSARFIPIMIRAIQQQQVEINKLRSLN